MSRRHWTIGIGVRLVAVALLFAAPRLALAQDVGDPTEAAREEFNAGRSAYLAGDYQTALSRFKAAQQLVPSAVLEYNMGLAEEAMGHAAEAVGHYRRYLTDKPGAENRRDIAARIESLRGAKAHPAPVATASEEECPPGQALVSDHCCWRGQIWSRRKQSCAGVPVCPRGQVPRGESCVAGRSGESAPEVVEEAAPKARGGQRRFAATDDTVTVSFVGNYRGEPYRVSSDNESCFTPCNLQMRPGAQHVIVSGPRQYEQDLLIPAHPVLVRVDGVSPRVKRAGAALMGTGFGLFGIGLALLSVKQCVYYGSGYTNCFSDLALSMPFIVIGWEMAMGVGLPLFASRGKDRLVLRYMGHAESNGSPSLKLAGVGLHVSNGGMSAGLTFSF